MSILQLEMEVVEINRCLQEAKTRQEALAAELAPMIDEYFKLRVSVEKNPDKRRDYAYFNSTRQFDIINENTLRFRSRNRSGPITCDVLVSELMDEYQAVTSA